MSTITESDKKYLLESWKRNVQAVSKVRPMDEAAKTHLACVLENTKIALRERGIRNENFVRGGITQGADITWFPDHVINMVSALYASQIAEEIVSIQPLDNPIGRIIFLQYLYGDTRGDNIAEQAMINEYGAMQNGNQRNRYASQLIDGEPVTSNGGAEIDAYLQNLPVLIDPAHPIDFVDNTNSGTVYRLKRVSEKGFALVELNAQGYETSANLIDMSKDVIVDNESGHVKFSIIAGKELTSGVNARYYQDLSNGPSLAGRVTLHLKTEQIKAEPHKLRAQYVFDAGYALSKSHGIDIEQCLIDACTTEIRHERDMEVINLLMKQAPASIQWNSLNSNYVSQREHNESFLQTLFSAASEIAYRTKKVFGNWVVVGKQGLDTIMSVGAPRFQASGLANLSGPTVVGTLDNAMKVIFSPYIARNEFLVGYKGDSYVDAGFVIGDYLPIASTDFITLDDFVSRKGFVSIWGSRMVNPNMYVRGIIV